MRFGNNSATIANNSICINISNEERNGEYEPYESHEYPLDSDLTLRGIPKLDANNKLYYDGDTYEADGTVTRKYGIVDLGTLDYVYSSGMFTNSDMRNVIKGATSNNMPINGISELYLITSYNSLADKCLAISTAGNIFIKNSAYTDATTFKTAMSGVYLVYELATPTTETADTFTNPQIVDDFGTEEYVDNREVAIPVGHETEYYQYNDKEKLDSLPDSAETDGNYVIKQVEGKMSLEPYSPTAIIDDTTPSANKTYSSNKIESLLPVEVTGTLTAGSTSLTLQDASIETTSTIDIYTDTFGIQPVSAVVATGSITLTFLAQASNLSVKVRVS